MDRRQAYVRAAVAAFLLCGWGAAHAYVSPSPPPGFGGSAGSWTYNPPTAGQQLGSILRGPGPSVAGSGPVSAAYRLGTGAARVLARASIPGALALGVLWLANNCFEKQGGSWVRTCGGTPYPQSDGYNYFFNGRPTAYKSLREACDAGLPIAKLDWPSYSQPPYVWTEVFCTLGSGGVRWAVSNNGAHVTNIAGSTARSTSTCPAGWYFTPAGCVQTPPPQPVTEQQVEDEMATKPLPSTLPPGVPYPLDPTLPSIWNPTIGDPPVKQPLRVPQGNPVPIPNTNPQQYRQPVTRVDHAPTTAEPWRMDTQPEDVISESPTGIQSPETITSETPPGEPKEETEIDICKANPDILACAKLDTPDAPDLETEDRGGPITPDSGWGGENASCPQPRILTVQGRQIPIPYTLFCTYMEGIRPLVIAMAWLSAGFILLGRKGGD